MKVYPTTKSAVSKESSALTKKAKGHGSSQKMIMLFDWQIELLEKIGTTKKDGTHSAIIKQALTDWCVKHGHSVPE